MWLALRCTLGTLWAWVPLIAGLGLWRQQAAWGRLIDPVYGDQLVRTAAVWFIASAQFVFMVMVADAVAPRVPRLARFALKWFVGAVFYLSLIWLAVLAYRVFA